MNQGRISVVTCLATDYDNTLAVHGRVDPGTVDALERWRAAGRDLVLITGRQLPDLREVFPRLDLFGLVVAENGALLHHPGSGREELLAAAPPGVFIRSLEKQGVRPLSLGRVIVATLRPHLQTVRTALDALSLPHRIILNQDAVMILPPGVDKGSGLRQALQRLGVAPTATVGIGDAENDLDFFPVCGLAVAVGDALEEVKRRADLVTAGGAGAGVVELIDLLLA